MKVALTVGNQAIFNVVQPNSMFTLGFAQAIAPTAPYKVTTQYHIWINNLERIT